MKALAAILTTLALVVAVPVNAPGLRAQEQATVSKQEKARNMFRDLHERMQKLQVLLAKTDPDESKVLSHGITYIQQAEIHQDMESIQRLLDGERWDESLEEMKSVRKELTQLMELLLNRNMDLAKLMEEIARLEAFKNRVDRLAKEQHEEKEASARTEALQKHLQDIEQAKRDIADILGEQKDLRDDTNQTGMAAADPKAAEKMADREGELKDRTEKIADDLEGLEKDAEDLKKEGEAKPGEAKPGDAKPGEAKPGEAKPGESKPGESKPGEGKPGGGSCSSCAGGAAKSMGKAQEKLGQNKPESSLKDQDQAIEKLQKALDELEEMAEEARRELLKLPFEQQAKAQEKTQVDTDTLAKDMEKSEEQGDGDGEKKQTPGRKNVQQAVPKQKAAAGSLKERVPAKQKQQDAKEDLEKAAQELEDALAQLRQQLQDEVLRALEERFGAMLAKQKELSALTKAVDRVRGDVLTADGNLPASLIEKCTSIGDGELSLGIQASDALKLLEEEGTTAVFPEIVAALRDDLYAVGKLIRKNQTGRNVQARQADIEDILRMLINALRRKIEENEGQCGQCNGGPPPLVPISAELKMIKFLQERVNKRTVAFETEVPKMLRDTEEATDEALDISGKQGRVKELTRMLAAKLGKENQANGGDGR